jgi:2-succinyl-6-hydroxy-2,4-cyclohexadiene-1-carboxylate synthase
MPAYPRVTLRTFIAEDGEEYYYVVDGDTRKPTLLLLAGFTGTHEDLLSLTEDLRDDYFVIVPDLPGWGKSPRLKKRLTLKNYAEYLNALLASLGVGHINLFGHCMGATLALEYALLYPSNVKKLILVSTPYNEGLLSQRLFLHLADISTHTPKFFRPLLFFWRSRLFCVPFAFISMKFKSFRKRVRVIWKGIKQQPHQHEDVVEENWVSFVHFRYERIKKLTMPTLILHGNEDLIVSAKQAPKLQQLLPQAKLEYIEGAGHLPPMETPGKLATKVKNFLREKN